MAALTIGDSVANWLLGFLPDGPVVCDRHTPESQATALKLAMTLVKAEGPPIS